MDAPQRATPVSPLRRGRLPDAERKVRVLFGATGEHGAGRARDVFATVRVGNELARARSALSALAHLVAGAPVSQLVVRQRRRAAAWRSRAGADDPSGRRDAPRGAQRNTS